MFVLRRTPALSLVGELYPADLANFNKERDELDRAAQCGYRAKLHAAELRTIS